MADNIPDFDKMTPEEVMAWMESLAKRQGAVEGFTTAADVDIAEIDPTTVQIDEPGYVPFGEENKKPAKPTVAPAPKPAQPAAAASPPAPPKPAPIEAPKPIQPAAELPPSRPIVPAAPPPPLPLEEPDQDTQPALELSGMAWLESLAADQGFDFPQIDLSALSADIEPAPLQVTTPSNPIDWLESIAEQGVEEVVEPAAPDFDAMADITDPLAAGIDPMLWLESLARRQGARSEELITAGNMDVPVPKDGVDTGPGYVDYTVEKDQSRAAPKAQPAPEPALTSDPNAWLASMVTSTPVEEAPTAKPATRMNDEEIRAALARGTDIPREDMEAFLDRQLTRQLEGADLPIAEDYDPNAPAVPAELPDWLMEQVQPPPAIRPTTELPALLDQIVEPPAVQDLPDWLKEDVSASNSLELENIFESETAPAVNVQTPIIDVNDPWVEAFTEEAELAGTDQVPEWYQRNVTDPKRIAAVEGLMRGEVDLEAEPLAPEAELQAGELQAMPDWLSVAAADVTVPDWIVSSAEEPEIATIQGQIDLPDWLRDAEVSVTEEEIPDWLRETADTMELIISEPTPPAPAMQITTPVPVVPPTPVPVVAAFTSPAPVPVTAAVDVEATLKNARAKYTGGDLNGSLLEYERIIRANTALDAVVGDMTRIMDQHKDNPAVYRVLGDSLMRQGKLQAALDTYRKALNQL